MHVFITVGSTRFDILTESLSNTSSVFLETLFENGFDSVTIQHGSGPPPKISGARTNLPRIECIDYCDNIGSLIEQADLVITHAGAGTLLECLRMKKPHVLAITNDTLMHGHQQELAVEFGRRGYISAALPCSIWLEKVREKQSCSELLQKILSKSCTIYPERDPTALYNYFEALLSES
jgi:beta-1,4-N-acetylglucosaminyltransferase